MKRIGFTLIELLVVVAIFLILVAILFPVFGRSFHDERSSSCRTNLRQIGLGFAIYVQDYDEKFPPIAVARSGYWAGSLQPYVKGWRIFQCPSAPKTRLKTTDYFYNSRLSGLETKDLKFPSQTFMAGDGNDDSSTNYAIAESPEIWRTTQKSPALRHYKSQGANYLFADAHVKYLWPTKISAAPPAPDIWTFASR